MKTEAKVVTIVKYDNGEIGLVMANDMDDMEVLSMLQTAIADIALRNRPVRDEIKEDNYFIDEYVIENRQNAINVLNSLVEYADKYATVSVADYYDLIDIKTNYKDSNYGWSFEVIKTSSIVPSRGGYSIKFPPVEVL